MTSSLKSTRNLRKKNNIKITQTGTSLVAQWLKIRLPTRVRALVREAPTRRRVAKPVRRNYWACALEPVLHNNRSHGNEKPAHHNKE